MSNHFHQQSLSSLCAELADDGGGGDGGSGSGSNKAATTIRVDEIVKPARRGILWRPLCGRNVTASWIMSDQPSVIR
jgi:hypothetical protein